ncbi:MAG: ECF transporter S component [Promethearchaeota archaeon]
MAEKPSSRSLYVATIGVLSALMAVLAFASVVIPTPLGSYDVSSVLIFLVAILYGPEIGMAVTCIGQFVGKGLLISYFGLPAIYIPGAIAVRGVEAYIVGHLGRASAFGRYREVLAMIIGVFWETAAFVAADYFLYTALWGPGGGIVAISFTVWTIVDLVWVPLGLAALIYARAAFKTTYMDKDLRLDVSSARSNVLLGSAIFVIFCWGLIAIACFMPGWLMGPVFPTP